MRRNPLRRHDLSGRATALALALTSACAAPAIAAEPAETRAAQAELGAILPIGAPVCYVRDFPPDELARRPAKKVASIRMYREDAQLALDKNRQPDDGAQATIDITLRGAKGAEPGEPPRRLRGLAYCAAHPLTGILSCSDDSGCDRADRLRIARDGDGVRLTFRGDFGFAGGGCGSADEDEPDAMDLGDGDVEDREFSLERRPLADCR